MKKLQKHPHSRQNKENAIVPYTGSGTAAAYAPDNLNADPLNHIRHFLREHHESLQNLLQDFYYQETKPDSDPPEKNQSTHKSGQRKKDDALAAQAAEILGVGVVPAVGAAAEVPKDLEKKSSTCRDRWCCCFSGQKKDEGAGSKAVEAEGAEA